MSVQADSALLVEKLQAQNEKLEAQLELARQKSRIADLEQEVKTLKAEKQMPVATSTGSLEPALRAENAQLREQNAQLREQNAQLREQIAQLQQQSVAKDVEREKEVSALIEQLTRYRKDIRHVLDQRDNVPRTWAAAMQEMDREPNSESAPVKSEVAKVSSHRPSDTGKMVKPSSVSPSGGPQNLSRPSGSSTQAYLPPFRRTAPSQHHLR